VNTLFEVEDTEGGELLIPANDKLITAVDTTQKTITLVIPDGLLEL
jgi:16S rRNA processing protein RimM